MPDGGATSFEPRKDFPSFEEVIGGRDPDLDHWLDYRRQYNAKAGGLWRVHNGLYDLSKFEHPGGNEWLAMTRGMDITEMFEAHHPDIAIARAILKKYYIKDADWPRESPLTFNENDFYAVLRDRVAKVVKEKGSSPRLLSKFIADTTAASFLALSYFSARKRSIPLALAAGFASGALVVMSHNFSHQGKQLRRFYYELTGGETKAIRIHHALSHHIYPNTTLDVEVPLFSSILGMNWWPHEERSKNSFWVDFLKYHTRLLPTGPLGALLSLPKHLLKPSMQIIQYIVPLLMIHARRTSGLPNSKNWRGVLETLGLWAIVKAISGWWGLSIGITVGHYSDVAWRQGETTPTLDEIRDFGLFQLETCGDRTDLYLPSTALHVPVVLSTFGDHTLHHLFPTVDHAYHRHLYSVLAQTCNEFGVRFEFVSQWQAVKGFFKELKRTEALQWRRRLGGKGEVGGWVDEKRGFKNDPTV